MAQPKTILWAFAPFIALGLAACSQAGPDDVDLRDQPVTEEARSEARGPGRLIEKLDRDGDGALELAELPERKQRWLAPADADKDGRITAEELAAQRAKHHEAFFKRFDKDGDGAWTEAEVGERWSKLQVADADGDGKLTMQELRAAHDAGKLGKLKGHRGKRGKRFIKDPAALLQKLDKDKNGTLELGELPERKRARLSGADTDKDGRLSADELKAHFERHRAKLGERMRAPKGAGQRL